MSDHHYLEDEFFALIKKDNTIFEFVQNLAPDGVWYWDLENPEHEWMNARFWLTLGYDPAAMPHRSDAWQNIIHPDDLQVALTNAQKHFADPNHPYDQVVRYRHQDGSTVWIHCKGVAIRDENGTPVRMLGGHIDVTELKEAEQREHKNAESYRAILDNQKVYINKTDLQGNYTYANDFFLHTFGLEADSYVGRSSMDTIFIDDHSKVIDTVVACLDTPHQPFAVTLRKPLPDGSLRVSKWDFTGLNDEDGNVTEILCIGIDVTEQVTAETKLSRTMTLLNNAQRIANIGGWELDVTTEKATLTDQVYAIHELPIDTPIDKVLGISFYHPDDQPIIAAAVNRAIEQQKPYDVQCRFITAKGNHRWVRTSGQPVVENGKVTRLIGMFQDITEQKEAELALQRTKTLLEDAGRIAKMGAWEFDVATNVGTFTDQVYAIHELPVSPSIDGKVAYTFYHPEDRPIITAAVNRALEQQKPYDVQCRFITAKGNHRWIRTSGQPVVENGKVTRLIGMFQDITERKQAEQALAASEATFRSFVENASDVIFTLSPQGTLLYISPQWETVKGFSREGLVGTSFVPLVHLDDVPAAFEAIKTIVASKKPYNGLVYRSKHGDGTWHWFSANGAPILDDAGNVTAILTTSRDITTDKYAKQAMQATLHRLEQTHNQNTMLMKEIHHRVKNNLAVISALLALRAQGIKDVSAKAALQESRQRIKVMAEIHELMYNHDSTGTIAFDEYLNALVSRIQRSFTHGARPIHFALQTSDVELSLDQAIPLGLIVNELLTNTTKHAFPKDHPEPRVAITVSVSDELVVEVVDNGVGVADEGVLEATDSLGMTVIQSLTDQLAGRITFSNRPSPEAGLHITLHIPLTSAPAEPTISASSVSHSAVSNDTVSNDMIPNSTIPDERVTDRTTKKSAH